MFGTTQLFVFVHPAKIDTKITYPEITYEFAQEEIRKKSGLDMGDDQSKYCVYLHDGHIGIIYLSLFQNYSIITAN